jgi:hypothetical protein
MGRLQAVEMFTSLVEQTGKMRTEINKKDKIYDSIMKALQWQLYVKLGTYNFEIVNDYAYLGAILTNKNELTQEIENTITN